MEAREKMKEKSYAKQLKGLIQKLINFVNIIEPNLQIFIPKFMEWKIYRLLTGST